MRIEFNVAGYRAVNDILPLTLRDVADAALEIERDYGIDVKGWPILTEWDPQTLWWELWFIRPATDEQYIANSQEYNDY